MTTPASPGTSTGPKARGLGWLVLPLAIFAGLAGLFALALTSGDPSKLPSALIGKPAPDTTFPALEGLLADGRPVAGFTSRDLAGGQVTVVNFWASWCGPCVAEHPLLEELRQKTGVAIYGVNYKDQPSNARRFLGRYGNPFTAVGVDGNGRNAIEWGVYGMPESFVVNGKGEIVYKHVGPISETSLAAKVIPAIEAARKGQSASK
ncbi:MAG: DsbE family thiol:disulfide interchange protein [Pseudomonadota bacterium]